MNTSTAFLEYLKIKDIKHKVTEDWKMTFLYLYCDTDLFEVAAHFSRQETLKSAAEGARMVEVSDDDVPNFWRPGPICVPNSNGADFEYVVSKNSILNRII